MRQVAASRATSAMNRISISISALGPTVGEQCEAHGITATGMKIETVDRICHALTLCRIHGMLTIAEVDRAHGRLLKAAKLRSSAP